MNSPNNPISNSTTRKINSKKEGVSQSGARHFHSLNLTGATRKLDKYFKDFSSTLNKLSEDIKTLEEYLLNNGFALNAKIQCGEYSQLRQEEKKKYQQYTCTILKEYLAWQKHEGKFRLMHIVEAQDLLGYTEDIDCTPHPNYSDCRIDSLRPLIETKAETRIEHFQKLPELVAMLANYVKKIIDEEFDQIRLPQKLKSIIDENMTKVVEAISEGSPALDESISKWKEKLKQETLAEEKRL